MSDKTLSFLHDEISKLFEKINSGNLDTKNLKLKDRVLLYAFLLASEEYDLKDIFYNVLSLDKFNKTKLIYQIFVISGFLLIPFRQAVDYLVDVLDDHSESFLSLNIETKKLKLYYYWGLIYKLTALSESKLDAKEIRRKGKEILLNNKLTISLIDKIYKFVKEKAK
jgi:hypothetical protein